MFVFRILLSHLNEHSIELIASILVLKVKDLDLNIVHTRNLIVISDSKEKCWTSAETSETVKEILFPLASIGCNQLSLAANCVTCSHK